MTKKTKKKPSRKTKNQLLLFWIITSLFVGAILGYEFANNTDSELFQDIGIHHGSIKADSVLPENIELCFTPPSGCADVIVKAISKARKSIYVQAYGMTSPAIVEALIKAQSRGVKVSVLLDKSNLENKWSKIEVAQFV